MKFVWRRDVPRILTIIFLLVLLFWGFTFSTASEQYPNIISNLILVGITAIYAWLTYELLRSARNNRASPYVNVEFMIVSSFDTDFFRAQEGFIEKSEEYLVIENDAKSTNPTERNIVFVKAKNTGDSLAIDIELDVRYSRKNFFDEHSRIDKRVLFQDLETGRTAIKIFEIFEHPSSNDYLEIIKLKIKFKDIALHNAGESSIDHDFSKRIHHFRDDGSTVVFKTPSED